MFGNLFSLNFKVSGLICLLVINIAFVQAEINLEQIKTDIETLASDEMQGRKVFTPAIDKAADYIAQRFEQIGLEPFSGLSSFKQSFSIYQISPKTTSVEINSEKIASEYVASLTYHKSRSWNKPGDFNIIFISENDDFRKIIGQVNQGNNDTLVLIDPKHKAKFARWQSFFSRLKSRLEVNTGPSLILVLKTEIDTFDIKTVKIHLTTSTTRKSLTNVIGILKGNNLKPVNSKISSKKNENVIFSAHYDHLGVKEEDTSHIDKNNITEDKEVDLIFNGADDDASGTTAVIALAEHYATQSNRNRDLIFVAFTAEEIGGFGSQYFSKQINADNIVAMINIEMIGKPSKFGTGEFWMTGFERSDLAHIINTNLEKSRFKMHQDPYPKQQLFYRSDNATLARLGVPAHSFSASQADTNLHYHKASDEVKTLDIKSMVEVIKKLSIATKPLVMGSATPTRLDTTKVRKKGNFF
ncbi:MAG: peptidase M23 [Kangiella sp.]|nr:MAG: peptidase M23 [Kangiella sp.]